MVESQRGLFDEILNAAEPQDALDRWLGEVLPDRQCGRCGVALREEEEVDCDDCRREEMAKRLAKKAEGKATPPRRIGQPVWTDEAGPPPDPSAMPVAMRQAFARQLKRHGEETLYCAHCRLPSGRFEVCYPCKVNPGRTPGRCDSCGVNCRPEFATCWECKA